MMDPLNPNQDPQESQAISGGGYSFNNVPNDAFGSFFNHDQSSLFNSAWEADVISDPQTHTTGFAPEHHAWRQNPLQASDHVHTPQYGLPVRGYGQSVSRIPPTFDYPGFDPHHGHTFSTPSYDPALSYGDPSLFNSASYGVSRPQEYERSNVQGQTISPQALQSYPNAYGQLPVQGETDMVTDPQLLMQGPTGHENRSHHQASSAIGGFLAHSAPPGFIHQLHQSENPADQLNATNSNAFNDFVFFGHEPIEYDDEIVTLPQVKLRRSRNEIRRKLLEEKGVTEWDSPRGKVLKKLKLSKPKAPRPGYTGTALNSQTSSAIVSGSSPEPWSENDESESEYSGSEEESEPEETLPLPPSRPLDPTKAIEYDIIKSVWSKSSVSLTGPEIRNALGEYWNVMKVLRDKWKSDQAGLQQAEDKKDPSKIAECKSRASAQRRIIETSIVLTLKHGHRDIVGKLGENATLLLMFYQLIADCFKDGDYSGILVSSILQILKRCDTVDQAVLEKVKLDKVLSRLLKRGDDQIKSLAQKVLDNATILSKQRKDSGKGTPAQEPAERGGANIMTAAAGVPTAAAGIKRQREGLVASAQPAKKSVSTIKSLPNSTSSGKATVTSNKRIQVSKQETKPAVNTTANNISTPKIKVNHVVAKPSTFFSSLQSASKKPGTSIAAQKSAQQIDGGNSKNIESKASTLSTAPAAAPKPSFSFAETMANLTKPKEVVSTTKLENRPPETAEEKAKRLRKEERRKLRVTFKPDDSLVDIRVFVHDPEEEVGHDDSMVRDVGDIGGEGRMLKMHKDLDMMDEDEDGNTGEETLAPWRLPSSVDFSVIEVEELNRNCTTRGGTMEVKSHERAVQEQRELTTLLAFYASLSDIPSSPREPSDPYTGEPMVERAFGTPQEETKIREAQFYSASSSQNRSSNQPTADISALLKLINGQQQQQPQSQPQLVQQQQASQAPASGLEAIFAQFSSGNPAFGQAPMTQAYQQPNAFGNDIHATLAALNQQTPVQSAYGVPTQAPTPDLQALLSQIQQPTAQTQGYDYQKGYAGENDRKRQYEYDDQSNNTYGYSNGKRVRGEKGKKFYGVPRVPCKFWQEGKCKKGDDCTFLHD